MIGLCINMSLNYYFFNKINYKIRLVRGSGYFALELSQNISCIILGNLKTF